MLKQRVPLRRKISFRDGQRAKFFAKGGWEAVQVAKPRKPIKKQSCARQREMRAYYEERVDFLLKPENLACAVCRCLGESPMSATEIHHARGRCGRLLRDQRFWVATCRSHRETPHQRPTWARAMGLLSTATEWNTYPEENAA